MKKPTDEWLVKGIDRHGARRRFVFHHDLRDSNWIEVSMHAVSTAIGAWGGDWNVPGHNITILSVTNQEEEEPPRCAHPDCLDPTSNHILHGDH